MFIVKELEIVICKMVDLSKEISKNIFVSGNN
jgi:hypothetical protein